MKHTTTLKHEFVEVIPEQLEEGTVYVSVRYATVLHRCCCGCGSEVVTPLSPTDWKLIFDGETVTLSPSIGNWDLPCRSHYWIWDGQVEWSGEWPDGKIEAARRRDRLAAEARLAGVGRTESGDREQAPAPQRTRGLWERLATWFRR